MTGWVASPSSRGELEGCRVGKGRLIRAVFAPNKMVDLKGWTLAFEAQGSGSRREKRLRP